MDKDKPLGIREFEKALAGHMSRTERSKVFKAMKEAGLLVFHA